VAFPHEPRGTAGTLCPGLIRHILELFDNL
jgi:hypothetical protein